MVDVGVGEAVGVGVSVEAGVGVAAGVGVTIGVGVGVAAGVVVLQPVSTSIRESAINREPASMSFRIFVLLHICHLVDTPVLYDKRVQGKSLNSSLLPKLFEQPFDL